MTPHMKLDEKALREILDGCKGVTPGPWETDTLRNDGEYGSGPDCGSGFDSYAVHSASTDYYGKPAVVCDTINSGVAVVDEEYDEVGHSAWDEQGRKNMAHVSRLDPQTVASIVTELLELRAHAPQGGVRVRPLEWKEHAGGWIAYAIFGPYRVQFDGANWHTHFAGKAVGDGPWPTADEAKTAAQADYEARIRAALTGSDPQRAGPAPAHPLDPKYDNIVD